MSALNTTGNGSMKCFVSVGTAIERRYSCLARRHPAAKEHSLENLPNLEVAVNRYMDVEGFINLKDIASVPPPEHLPKDIEATFKEGAMCKSVGCYNAAGTMFRLCVDLATRSRLPEKDVPGLNATTRRNLVDSGCRRYLITAIFPKPCASFPLVLKTTATMGRMLAAYRKPTRMICSTSRLHYLNGCSQNQNAFALQKNAGKRDVASRNKLKFLWLISIAKNSKSLCRQLSAT